MISSPSRGWWLVPCVVVAACGGGDEATPDASSTEVPDAAVAPDAVPYPCELGTSTVEGTGPDGDLTGMSAFPMALTGFCIDSVGIGIRPSPTQTSVGVDVFADLPVPWTELPVPWSGTLTARVYGQAAREEGTFDLTVTYASHPDGETRFAASGTASGDGWSFTVSVDAPYCGFDTCL
jgi:hypothetical protein